MNVDIGLVEWALGGILTAGAMLSGYLYKELRDADRNMQKDISEFKTHVAGNYVPRSEIQRMLDLIRQDIKDKAEEIKDFIDARIGGGSDRS